MFTQEDIDRAVQKALEPVLEQFNAIKANRDQILAEKRKRIVGKTEDGIIRTEQAIFLPREIARDPANYQRWKAQAAEDGLELRVLTETKAEPATLPDTFTGPRVHYVRNDLARDPHFYRQEKSFAERQGLTMHLFKTAAELPPEATSEKA